MLVLVTTLLPSHSTPPENIIETSKWLAGIEYSRLDQGHLSKYAKENMVEETRAAIHAKAFDIDAQDAVGRGTYMTVFIPSPPTPTPSCSIPHHTHHRHLLPPLWPLTPPVSLPHPSLALYSIAI